MLYKSPDLKFESGAGSGSGGLHVINQVTLNDYKNGVWGGICGYSICSVCWSRFVCCILTRKVMSNEKNMNVDTMCGNTLPSVIHNAYVPHYQLMIK